MTNRCGTSDIDFIFLLDTSGSVGYVNWETTTTFIGKNTYGLYYMGNIYNVHFS